MFWYRHSAICYISQASPSSPFFVLRWASKSLHVIFVSSGMQDLTATALLRKDNRFYNFQEQCSVDIICQNLFNLSGDPTSRGSVWADQTRWVLLVLINYENFSMLSVTLNFKSENRSKMWVDIELNACEDIEQAFK